MSCYWCIQEQRGRMVRHTCVVKGCKSQSDDGSGCRFFFVPALSQNKEEDVRQLFSERRRKWTAAAGYNPSEFEMKSHHRICSRHFVSGTVLQYFRSSFITARCYASAVYAIIVCISLVTRGYCLKMSKCRITLIHHMIV